MIVLPAPLLIIIYSSFSRCLWASGTLCLYIICLILNLDPKLQRFCGDSMFLFLIADWTRLTRSSAMKVDERGGLVSFECVLLLFMDAEAGNGLEHAFRSTAVLLFWEVRRILPWHTFSEWNWFMSRLGHSAHHCVSFLLTYSKRKHSNIYNMKYYISWTSFAMQNSEHWYVVAKVFWVVARWQVNKIQLKHK